MAVQVVDADHHRQPVGGVDEDVVVPAGGEFVRGSVI